MHECSKMSVIHISQPISGFAALSNVIKLLSVFPSLLAAFLVLVSQSVAK